MLKRSLMAGLAGTVLLGVVGLAPTPAAAQVCLNPYAGAVSLSQYPMDPGNGFGYDRNFVNQQLAKGNRCATTAQQSAPVSPRIEYNRRANPNAFKSGGRYY